MIVVADAEQPRLQRNLHRKIERVPCHRVDSVIKLCLRPTCGIDDRPTEVGALGCDDDLAGHSLRRGEDRSQTLMAAHHISQCRAQRLGIERARQPQPDRHVVGRRRPLQLIEEPQPVLGERQRDHLGPVLRHQWFQPNPVAADAGRQLCDRRRLKQCAHRETGIQTGVDGGDQAHCRQRIPTQIEERVVHPDPIHSQHPGEDSGQDLLGRSGRGPVTRGVLILRRRQGPPIEFSVDRQRQRIDDHDRRRNHVLGQPLGQRGAHRHRVGCAGDVAHQSLVAGTVFAGDHLGLLHPVQPRQRGAHLTQLDPETTNLDLLVGATDIVQLPVRAP